MYYMTREKRASGQVKAGTETTHEKSEREDMDGL